MNLFKRILLSVFLIAAPLLAFADIQKDKDYRVIPDTIAQGEWIKPSEAGKVDVIEFFSYGCPACNNLAPTFHAWMEKKPANASIKRVPVVFFQGWDVLAKAYYTAEQLHVLDKVDTALFDAIHKEHKTLTDKESIRKIFVAHGVDGKQFDKTFDSFTVDDALRKGNQTMQHFKIFAVPSVLVGGRYVTDMEMAKDPSRLIEIVNELVVKAEQDMKSAK